MENAPREVSWRIWLAEDPQQTQIVKAHPAEDARTDCWDQKKSKVELRLCLSGNERSASLQ